MDAKGEKAIGKVREAMADEIMYQIAALMPAEYRGKFIHCDPPPQKYLNFI
jgi:hypothetical protein